MKSKMFVRKIYLATIVCLLVGGLLFTSVAPAFAWRTNKIWINWNFHNWNTPGANDLLIQATAAPIWPWGNLYWPRVEHIWSPWFPNWWWWTTPPWTNVKYGYRTVPLSMRVWGCVSLWVRPFSFVFYRAWWTVNSVNTWRLAGFGWRIASSPTIFLPPDETRGVIVRDLQFANSEGVISLENLTTEGTAGLIWDTARTPIVVNPGDTYNVLGVTVQEPEPAEVPENERRTVVARGTVVFEDEAANPDAGVPFVVQFGNEAEPPPTGINTYWLAALALLAMAMGLVVIKRAKFLRA